MVLVIVAACSSGSRAPETARRAYASRAHDGVWSPAQNLGAAVNSPFADFAPAFSPDGKYLFFTSERPGVVPTPVSGRPPGDIYQIDVTSLGI
jgi:Tol biopolymer transport system component